MISQPNIGACGGVVNVYESLVRLLLAHAPVLTIVSYVASPLLAIVSFVLNRLDRKALRKPPRMTLGSINALVASHYFIVPTILDSLSVEAVSQFLTNVRAIKSDLALDVELAGIVGMMTRQVEPSERERRGLELAKEGGYAWRPDTDFVFKTTLPRRVDIAGAAGEDIAYFLSDSQGKPLRELFDPLFEEICTSVWRGNGP
jgi:cellulose biosynthesis protein BcsQ